MLQYHLADITKRNSLRKKSMPSEKSYHFQIIEKIFSSLSSTKKESIYLVKATRDTKNASIDYKFSAINLNQMLSKSLYNFYICENFLNKKYTNASAYDDSNAKNIIDFIDFNETELPTSGMFINDIFNTDMDDKTVLSRWSGYCIHTVIGEITYETETQEKVTIPGTDVFCVIKKNPIIPIKRSTLALFDKKEYTIIQSNVASFSLDVGAIIYNNTLYLLHREAESLFFIESYIERAFEKFKQSILPFIDSNLQPEFIKLSKKFKRLCLNFDNNNLSNLSNEKIKEYAENSGKVKFDGKFFLFQSEDDVKEIVKFVTERSGKTYLGNPALCSKI